MEFTSSRTVRRLLNRLIRFINYFLPWGEKIWLIPEIRFLAESKKEMVVLEYEDAIASELAAWLGNFNENDPHFKDTQRRVEELEARYGSMLDVYLAPYERAGRGRLSQHEDHRIAVARYRARAKARRK